MVDDVCLQTQYLTGEEGSGSRWCVLTTFALRRLLSFVIDFFNSLTESVRIGLPLDLDHTTSSTLIKPRVNGEEFSFKESEFLRTLPFFMNPAL